MKSRILALALAAMAPGQAALAQDAHVALLKNVSGDVHVVRNQARLNATPGMRLMPSDVVVSAEGASGGIVFKDGTLMTLGSASELEIRRYVFEPKASQYDFSMYLSRGTAVYSSGKIGKLAPEAISINTPRAAVGVRGTRFVVKVD